MILQFRKWKIKTMSKEIKTKFDIFKSMTLEQFAEWFDKYGQFDGSRWMSWFD